VNLESAHIEIKALQFGYSNHRLLDKPLHFTAKQGEFICVAGKNGCGKSTLLKTILTLHQPISGSVLLNKKDIYHLKNEERAFYIAYADADRQIFGNFTVKDYLLFGRYPYLSVELKPTEQDIKQIEQLVEYFNIAHLLQKDIQTLSSGEYRMLQIVTAFVQDTQVVILDEPTANLDLDKSVNVFDKLSDLAKRQNKLIIIATHQINLAFKYASKILLFHQRNYYFDSPSKLAKAPVMQAFFDNDSLHWNAEKMIFEW
tara:strand:- start:15066 stop:15839 length:774 start_codon:yes stop_codon:yes gene_type:complete